MVLAVAVVVVAALALATLGFRRLRSVCLEQCVVTDMSSQVSITSGKMVKPDVIAENLGLRTGVNLALIDFERRREELLSRIPTLRSVSITRHLPDRVTIVAEERVPVAKMGVRGQRAPTGRVVDSEGMVFPCMRGVQLLPTIVEPSPGTSVGQKLKGCWTWTSPSPTICSSPSAAHTHGRKSPGREWTTRLPAGTPT